MHEFHEKSFDMYNTNRKIADLPVFCLTPMFHAGKLSITHCANFYNRPSKKMMSIKGKVSIFYLINEINLVWADSVPVTSSSLSH